MHQHSLLNCQTPKYEKVKQMSMMWMDRNRNTSKSLQTIAYHLMGDLQYFVKSNNNFILANCPLNKWLLIGL